MIDAQYYYTIYLTIVAILTFCIGGKYSKYPNNRVKGESLENIIPSLLLLIVMVIFIGTRPINNVFADMGGYAEIWFIYDEGTFRFTLDRENFIFDNVRAYMSTNGMSIELFFILIALIYFTGIHLACRKLFPNDTMFVFLIYLAGFSTFSYGTNGIKAGSAAAWFLVSLAYRDKVWLSILLGIISWGFHHSMIMVLCSYAVVLCFKNPKYYFALWIFSFLCAVTHISFFQNIFGHFLNDNGDEHGAGYLLGLENSGFRLDFILYSAMPILVGYYAIYKKNIESQMYNTLLNLYLMTNSMWMFCMYANFTNRIAYLSWFMYPIVLIYPLFKENWSNNQYKIAKKIAYAHLGFTIFMQVIYYGFLGLGN